MNSKYFVIFLAGLASLFSFNVGETSLRISLGIIVLVVGLLLNEKFEVLSTATLTGIFVFLIRVLFQTALTQTISASIIFSYLLEVFFYIGYGISFKYLVRNEQTRRENSLLILLMLCDFGANSLEYFAHYFLLNSALIQADFVSIFLAAFIRSSIIWIILTTVLNHNTDSSQKI